MRKKQNDEPDVITDRKMAEKDLKESEEKYRRLFEHAKLGIFQSTPGGEAISVNPAFAEMFGYDSVDDALSSLKNVGTDLFFDPGRREEIIRLMKENPAIKTFENIYKRKDGSSFTGTLHTMLIRDQEGKVIRAEGIIEDISKKKQAEEELRESEMRFRSTFDKSPVGSVIVGMDNRFIRCNKAFCKFLGYEEEELTGRTFLEVTFTEDMEIGREEMSQMAEAKIESARFQKRYVTKRGNIVWGEINITLVRDADQNPLYFLPVILDITEQKQKEQIYRIRLKSFLSW
ncbi:MAG: PAS domain S-box protein [Bacteroidota bacterium]